jgi:DNA-binding transcriptional MerR regulator
LSTLHFIKSAQELGFPLDEIRELLKLRSDTVKACPTMKAILQAKLATVEGKIESLDTLRAELKAALHKCDTKLKASSGMTSEGCPVLADISKAT